METCNQVCDEVDLFCALPIEDALSQLNATMRHQVGAFQISVVDNPAKRELTYNEALIEARLHMVGPGVSMDNYLKCHTDTMGVWQEQACQFAKHYPDKKLEIHVRGCNEFWFFSWRTNHVVIKQISVRQSNETTWLSMDGRHMVVVDHD